MHAGQLIRIHGPARLTDVKPGVHAGLAMFEKSASGLEIVREGGQPRLNSFHLPDRQAGPVLTQPTVQLRVHVDGDEARYSYSLDDGKTFLELGTAVNLRFSWWKGSRPALFALHNPGH